MKDSPTQEEQAKIRIALLQILKMLVQRDYEALEQITRGKRLSAKQIQSAVEEYGRTLVLSADAATDEIDTVKVRGASPAQFSVRLPLFTEEEGRSDLELQATLVYDAGAQVMRVELDGILVA